MKRAFVLAVALLLCAFGSAKGVGLATLPPLEPLPTAGISGGRNTPEAPPDLTDDAAPAAPGIGAYRGDYRVEVSSYRVNNDRTIVVDGRCAMDGDLNTAWNTNARDAGEWIRLSTADGRRYAVAGFRIANGYWKSSRVYGKNSRLREVSVACDGKCVARFTLQDVQDLQTFLFPEIQVCGTFELTIESSYPGSAYRDCCVTELDLIGPDTGVLSPEAMDDWGRIVGTFISQANRGGLSGGDGGCAVLGLQLLLREGLDVYFGPVNGSFDGDTRSAVRSLAREMGVSGDRVDAAFWKAMQDYMRRVG